DPSGVGPLERRLTTILSADVAGYSRLMERDEAGTLVELMARHTAIIEPLITQAGGRIVKTLGDGFLAEFASPVNAVTFAVDMQQASEARNAKLPEDRRMSFRIGINLSDVIVEQNDVFGEGVTVASGLQASAEPGSVIVSDSIYQQVQRQLPLAFEDGGKRQVYDRKVGTQWRFFERPKRRGREIEWIPVPEPALSDWLELLDAVERGYVRRRFMPDDIRLVRTRIRELFPEHELQ
ncbi:MAG: adenylate/guanylate cyclase domain-containing protein, partial [Verrucomicrobiota bacterium]